MHVFWLVYFILLRWLACRLLVCCMVDVGSIACPRNNRPTHRRRLGRADTSLYTVYWARWLITKQLLIGSSHTRRVGHTAQQWCSACESYLDVWRQVFLRLLEVNERTCDMVSNISLVRSALLSCLLCLPYTIFLHKERGASSDFT